MYFSLPLTEETPLEYFIPTTTGAGVCTHVLMRFLVDTHNEFLMECDHQLAQKERRYDTLYQNDEGKGIVIMTVIMTVVTNMVPG